MIQRWLSLPALALALAVPAAAAALSPPGPVVGAPLTLGELGAGGPAVAIAGPNVYVAWSAPGGEILLRPSADGGRSFGPAVVISGTATPSLNPSLAADGGRVYVAWLEQEDDGNSLLLRSSADGGATFGPAVSLAGPDLAGPTAELAAATGRVHAAWEHADGDERGDVLVRSSEDGGGSFGPALPLNEGHAYGSPRIAAAGDTVFVAWDDFAANDGSDVFLAASADGGRSFDATRRLAEDLDRNSRHVALAVTDGRVSVAWEDCPAFAAGECEIRLRRGGPAPDFDAALAVARDAVLPAAAAAGRFLHVLAVYPAPRGHALALIASRDYGSTFAAPRLLGAVDPGPLPAIAAGEAGFAAAWSDRTAVRFVRWAEPAFQVPPPSR